MMFGNMIAGCKNMMKIYLPILGLLLFVSCKEPTLDSAWRPSDPADSATSQYSSYILNGEDVVVALQNDGHNLYLRIKATNTASQMKMISGLTVWFDGGGKKKKNFGIQYPLAKEDMMRPGGKPGEHRERKEGGGPGGPGEPGRPEIPGGFERPGGFPGMGSSGKDSMMILGPGEDDRHIIGIHNEYGISASITHEGGPMIYDLTIPLTASDATPYAIGIKPGGLISLGIVTATSKSRPKEMERGDRPKKGGSGGGDDSFGGSGGGQGTQGGFGEGGDWGGDGDWGGGGSGPSGGGPPSGGGMGRGPGGGGRGPGGGKGRPGGSEGINANPLKFWAKIRLASASQVAQ
jgi:hypothetical protein